ncbi:MlaA family lipoprotein [Vannielia litorea]|uniref:Phospholipid-binding lipoprotein MlaA n=1 Tax=Vannielia litorea TaxID=1217970 RepID=A0A1N6H882_9RHOB|nr:VacJ family lipoprotein [Vannielia litorea]SIO15877.1 phospholipid-binding lipoprotein MlaA [Vannielia litorea]
MQYSVPTGRHLAPLLLVASVFLAGCTANTTGETVFDPYEAQNRKVHAFNKRVDRAMGGGKGGGVGQAIPEPVTLGLSNLSTNFSQPSYMMNHLLQGNMEGAMRNFWRALVNTTVGIGGLFDPATRIGLHDDATDFGVTLAKLGIQEGAYVELPILGPSTERDVAGKVFDVLLNPLQGVIKAEDQRKITVIRVFSRAGDRAKYSETVDSVLYDSADSYAQSRIIYLQNRRGQTGDTAAAEAEADEVYDSYEDFYSGQ